VRADLLAVRRRVTKGSDSFTIHMAITADGRHADFSPSINLVLSQLPTIAAQARAYEAKVQRLVDWTHPKPDAQQEAEMMAHLRDVRTRWEESDGPLREALKWNAYLRRVGSSAAVADEQLKEQFEARRRRPDAVTGEFERDPNERKHAQSVVQKRVAHNLEVIGLLGTHDPIVPNEIRIQIEKVANNPAIELLHPDDFHENEMVRGENGRRVWALDEYRNPTPRVIYFVLDTDVARPSGERTPQGAIILGGVQKRLVLVLPDGTALIPRSYRSTIHTTDCDICDEHKRYCKNESHSRRIVAGLGIGLERLGARNYEVHPALKEQTAHTNGASVSAGRDERLMARAMRGAS
jgi:hypothetical protein